MINAPPRQVAQADAVAVAALGVDTQGPLFALRIGEREVVPLRSPAATGITTPFSLSTLLHEASVPDNMLRAMWSISQADCGWSWSVVHSGDKLVVRKRTSPCPHCRRTSMG